MFWTDVDQANERLTGTIVSYGGVPTYIEEVRTKSSGIYARAELLENNDSGTFSNISLEDKKWNKFRDLPRLGWFNCTDELGNLRPVYLERRAVNSRSHGLTNPNTQAWNISNEGILRDRGHSIRGYLRNPGYLETCKGDEEYPKLSTILMSVGEGISGAAFSSKFCVVSTEEGMKWLYRKSRRIGFFSGTDSLNLFPKQGFFKEEIEATPSFDITNIKEF